MPDINPLLQHWQLPPWSAVRAEHLLPAVEYIVADNQLIIDNVIATQVDHPNWDDVVIAIDEADARLAETMAIIEFLTVIHSNDADWLLQSALSSNAAARFSATRSSHRGCSKPVSGWQRARLPPASVIRAKPRWRKSCADFVWPALSCQQRSEHSWRS
ncbi:hypothetical protein LJJ44_24650 [Pseudomonas sp. B24_DOA]|nr:hypothetical protein LJJ44_24650 [Pseudomonas sp. B24_DOA]